MCKNFAISPWLRWLMGAPPGTYPSSIEQKKIRWDLIWYLVVGIWSMDAEHPWFQDVWTIEQASTLRSRGDANHGLNPSRDALPMATFSGFSDILLRRLPFLRAPWLQNAPHKVPCENNEFILKRWFKNRKHCALNPYACIPILNADCSSFQRSPNLQYATCCLFFLKYFLDVFGDAALLHHCSGLSCLTFACVTLPSPDSDRDHDVESSCSWSGCIGNPDLFRSRLSGGEAAIPTSNS